MKKIWAFLLCACIATTILVSGSIFALEGNNRNTELDLGLEPQSGLETESEFDYALKTGLITRKVASYNDKQYYQGNKVTNSQIDVASFADFDIISTGGNHVDGEGDLVFSNYVAYNIFLNFNKSTKYINGTNVKVSDDSCDWNDKNDKNNHKYGDSTTDTEKPISYGAILATRTDGDGSVFYYEPVFSNGNNSFEQQLFNQDGDYTVYIFFETVKNNKYQNHILSWSFKIRSSIYLRDTTSDLHIKNSGISGNDVIIDIASRENIRVQVYKDNLSCLDLNSSDFLGKTHVLSDPGLYKFIVTSNGFTSEVFYFLIDKENVDKKVFFSNLRRQIGSNSYEAEGYFSFEWNENALNPIQWATYIFCDGVGKDMENLNENKFSDSISYTPKTILDQVGTYIVTAYDGKQTATFYINVVPMDKPSTNYDKLSSERFNTFKTKWWQVYDETSGRYFCFDYDTEYDRAYNAAMTIANNSVIDRTGRYFFKGNWYNDRVELTVAMNEYVFAHNLSVFYYDPADYADNKESERTFSAQAFDNTIYLNDEFQFVSEHPSEVTNVVLTDSNGNEYEMAFSTPISQQQYVLSDGVYLVKETDKYGNETTYTAYRDKSAPEISFSSNNGDITATNAGKYTVNYFSISSLFDKYDEYAIIKIESSDDVQYFYKTEYTGVVFDTKGEYKISSYDRNGNMISFTITVS